MTTLLEALLLALVQGLTEWLPISSSGHLVIILQLLKLQSPLLLSILLHLGTTLVVLAYFRREISAILQAIRHGDWKSEHGKTALLIIIGNVPTAILGFAFYETFAALFNSLAAVGVALVITGLILLSTMKARGNGEIGVKEALLMGTMQGIAIIPGLSRSGFTISAALLMGVDREKSFKFSFLLAIPAILGATVMETVRGGESLLVYSDFLSVSVAVVAAMIVGYASLALLHRTLAAHRFHWFALYCIPVGLVLLLSQLVL